MDCEVTVFDGPWIPEIASWRTISVVPVKKNPASVVPADALKKSGTERLLWLHHTYDEQEGILGILAEDSPLLWAAGEIDLNTIAFAYVHDGLVIGSAKMERRLKYEELTWLKMSFEDCSLFSVYWPGLEE